MGRPPSKNGKQNNNFDFDRVYHGYGRRKKEVSPPAKTKNHITLILTVFTADMVEDKRGQLSVKSGKQ